MSQWIGLRVIISDDYELNAWDARTMVKAFREELMKFLPVRDVEYEDYKPKEEVKDE